MDPVGNKTQIRYSDSATVTHLLQIFGDKIKGAKKCKSSDFHYSYTECSVSCWRKKSIAAHKNGYIATGFTPPLILVCNSNIFSFREKL